MALDIIPSLIPLSPTTNPAPQYHFKRPQTLIVDQNMNPCTNQLSHHVRPRHMWGPVLHAVPLHFPSQGYMPVMALAVESTKLMPQKGTENLPTRHLTMLRWSDTCTLSIVVKMSRHTWGAKACRHPRCEAQTRSTLYCMRRRKNINYRKSIKINK